MPEPDALSLLLAQTVARHFPGARCEGDDIDLGFAGVRARCRVENVRALGPQVTASLFVWFHGGPFAAPVFASASGYGDSAEDAVLTGGCQWTCTFGPVLRASLAGEAPAETVSVREVRVHGRRMRLLADTLDRGLSLDEARDPSSLTESLRAARLRLGGGLLLTERIAAADVLPLPAAGRPTVLSAFCAERADDLTFEVKVDGTDWPSDGVDLPHHAAEPGVFVMLREFAVLVPQEPAPALDRAALAVTLGGLPAASGRRSAAFRGFRAHRGRLGEPLREDAIASLERDLGPLPDDYRAFLREVAASGAGPGYGLLRPDHPAQRALAKGTFPFAEDTADADAEMRGAIVLAHAGCAVMWLLVLRGPRRGEVWVDAGGSDHGVRRVAPSFTDWYRGWLEACVSDTFPWLQWDSSCCASASVLSQILTRVEQDEGLSGEAALARLRAMLRPGALALGSGGGPYFATGDALDPCAGCVDLFDRLGLAEEVFPAGTAPLQARPAPAGWFRRLLGKA